MLGIASEATVVVEAEEDAEVIAGEVDEEIETSIVVEEDEGLIAEARAIRDPLLVVETLETETPTGLHHRESQIHTCLLVVVEDAMIAEDLLHQHHVLLLLLDQTQGLARHLVAATLQLLVVGLLHQTTARTDTEGGEVEVEEEVLIGHPVGDPPPSLALDLPSLAKAEDPHPHRPVYLLRQDLEDLVVTVARDLDLLQVREAEVQEEEDSRVAESGQRLHQRQQQMRNLLKPLLALVGVVMIANVG